MSELPDKVRAFVSINIDRPILKELRTFQQTLEDGVPKDSIRWSSPEQLHLTLKFLGNVAASALTEVQDALAQIIEPRRVLHLSAEGLGGFPNLRNPRVVWVGVKGDVEPLLQLQAQIEKVTAPWSQKEENRAFHPHLTLGRVREKAFRHTRRIGEFLQGVEQPEFGRWRVLEIHLMRSQLSPKGSTYTVLADLPLRGN